MQNLRVTLVQSELYWENPQANLSMLEEKIWNINRETDLIILPEMFPTGFTMNAAAVAEPMNLTSTRWMKQIAAQTGAVVTGSLVIKEDKQYFNRLFWMQPDGNYLYYDKRHLFRMAGEHKIYSAGKKPLVANLKGWRIAPFVCYDLRFPVYTRNLNNYDLLLFVANWPAARNSAWKTLLPARAIENLSYSIGVNRVGKDGNGIEYSGDSGIWNFKGEQLAGLESKDTTLTFELDKEKLNNFRAKFPAFMDADNFTIDF